MKPRSEIEGLLLHAKHALQPNSLGYCGPDENGRILENLRESSASDSLAATLAKFEAAYPFIRMIAKATGRRPFDRDVTEAYWIGNPLLDRVQPSDFYKFALDDLAPSRMKVGKKDNPRRLRTRSLFKETGALARPHHTFYVLAMYAGSSVKSGSEAKLLDLMDSCRVSWGRVSRVGRDRLTVERPRLALADGRLSLTHPETREVHYDPLIPPFSAIRRGDWVSVHWNFASEKLSLRQVDNLRAYTGLDMEATNRFAALKGQGLVQ